MKFRVVPDPTFTRDAGSATAIKPGPLALRLIKYVQPTHRVTIEMEYDGPIRKVPREGVSPSGDGVNYTEAYNVFIRSLSKRLTPRDAWEIHQPILRSAWLVTEASGWDSSSVHVILAKPYFLSQARFLTAVRQSATESPWPIERSMPVDIQPITRRELFVTALNIVSGDLGEFHVT